MQVGDIIELPVSEPDNRFRVLQHERMTRTYKVIRWGSNELSEITDDLDATDDRCKVLCNPANEWPFVATKVRSTRIGPVVSVLRSSENRLLIPMDDWAPTDQLKAGGALFFNPALRLRQGEVLVATHQGGLKTRISITQAFGSVKLRRKRAEIARKPPEPLTAFDRILQEDSFQDEDD